MIVEAVLCLFIFNGTAYELDCSFDIYFVGNPTYRWIEDGTTLNNTIGFINFPERYIFINNDYTHLRDRWGMNAYEHEVLHAHLYLQWIADGREGWCPCWFHE